MARTLTKKICLLGDFAVGKTSLVRRFVESRFDERYLSTIGVKIDRKVLRLSAPEGDVMLTLMVWDLAGAPGGAAELEEAEGTAPIYYRGAGGAILTCDLTRPETVASVERYAQAFLEVNPQARLILAANKVDLVGERRLGEADLAGVVRSWHLPLFITSAKTGEQVEAMFEEMGRLLVG